METPWTITTTEWEMTYAVQPSTPIGIVRLQDGEYRAWCGAEDLGLHPAGDDAAWAIWRRFCDQSAVRHEEASVTHGAYERHVRTLGT